MPMAIATTRHVMWNRDQAHAVVRLFCDTKQAQTLYIHGVDVLIADAAPDGPTVLFTVHADGHYERTPHALPAGTKLANLPPVCTTYARHRV